MSQKIIIPKGAIDSSHTTIIEIPNYLHETTTVVVATPRKAESGIEQNWRGNEYSEENSGGQQNDSIWEQDYEPQEMGEDADYSPEQQEQYDFDAPQTEDPEAANVEDAEGQGNEQDQPGAKQEEKVPPPQPRRVNYEPYEDKAPTAHQCRSNSEAAYNEHMRKRMMDKKRELNKLRCERQKMIDGEFGTYEAVPVPQQGNLSEVPENMRGRSVSRDRRLQMEKKRQQQEFERLNASQIQADYQPPYPRDRVPQKFFSGRQNQYYPPQKFQQWGTEVQGYPNIPYPPRQGQPRPQIFTAVPHRGQLLPNEANIPREDMRQYQKPRRRPTFSIPRNN